MKGQFGWSVTQFHNHRFVITMSDPEWNYDSKWVDKKRRLGATVALVTNWQGSVKEWFLLLLLLHLITAQVEETSNLHVLSRDECSFGAHCTASASYWSQESLDDHEALIQAKCHCPQWNWTAHKAAESKSTVKAKFNQKTGLKKNRTRRRVVIDAYLYGLGQ